MLGSDTCLHSKLSPEAKRGKLNLSHVLIIQQSKQPNAPEAVLACGYEKYELLIAE